MNHALDQVRESYLDEWAVLSDSYAATANVIKHTPDFDPAIENPAILQPLLAILGPDITFEELDIIVRKPTRNLDEVKGFHRDHIRDYNRRMEITAISAVYYLTDVTESDHSFTIIPGTHGRLVDMRPSDCAPHLEVDLTGPAGTAILFHSRCLHTGKLKPESRERRSLHLYYDKLTNPRTSEWTDFPPRLYQKNDPTLPPHLYAKWNRTDILDGTGRKPKGLDPTLPQGVLIAEAQRQAKLIAQQT
jgi:hypothetical protein